MQVTINDHTIDVEPGTTVLEAIHSLGQDVPTLCYDPRQAPFGACRVCLVGAEGAPGPIPACTTQCREGMRIDTHDETARRVASAVVELVLSELPQTPAAHTELATVAYELGVMSVGGNGYEPVLRWPGPQHERHLDDRHPYLALQHELCISCGRCIRACDEVHGAFALTSTGRGFSANVTAGLDAGFLTSPRV